MENLSVAATGYLMAIIHNETPKQKGVVAKNIEKKLIKEKLLTEKGKPTKKALDAFRIEKDVVRVPEGAINVLDDTTNGIPIGYLAKDEACSVTMYDLFVLHDGKADKVGYTTSQENGIAKIRQEKAKLLAVKNS